MLPQNEIMHIANSDRADLRLLEVSVLPPASRPEFSSPPVLWGNFRVGSMIHDILWESSVVNLTGEFVMGKGLPAVTFGLLSMTK